MNQEHKHSDRAGTHTDMKQVVYTKGKVIPRDGFLDEDEDEDKHEGEDGDDDEDEESDDDDHVFSHADEPSR